MSLCWADSGEIERTLADGWPFGERERHTLSDVRVPLGADFESGLATQVRLLPGEPDSESAAWSQGSEQQPGGLRRLGRRVIVCEHAEPVVGLHVVTKEGGALVVGHVSLLQRGGQG